MPIQINQDKANQKHNAILNPEQMAVVYDWLELFKEERDRLDPKKDWQTVTLLEKQSMMLVSLVRSNRNGLNFDSAKMLVGQEGAFVLGSLYGIGIIQFDPETGSFHIAYRSSEERTDSAVKLEEEETFVSSSV